MYEVVDNEVNILVVATTWSERILYYGPFPNEGEAIKFMVHAMTHQASADEPINGFTLQFMNKVMPPYNFNEVATLRVT